MSLGYIFVLICFFLGCAPLEQDASDADAGVSSPSVSPGQRSENVRFEVGTPWVALNSALALSDQNNLQLVAESNESFAVHFAESVSYYSTNGKNPWNKISASSVNPFLKVFDAVVLHEDLHAVGVSGEGLAVYKMTESRQFEKQHSLPGKVMEVGCVARDQDSLHIFARPSESAFIEHYVWNREEGFSKVEMSNLIPSSAGIDCVRFRDQFYLLYKTSQENKRPASVWKSAKGANWSKLFHDISTDLGEVSLAKTHSHLMIVGADAYMSSFDAKSWRYFSSANSSVRSPIDITYLQDSLMVLSSSDKGAVLFGLGQKVDDSSALSKGDKQLRSREMSFEDQLVFDENTYLIKQDTNRLYVERITETETVEVFSETMNGSKNIQFSSSDSEVFMLTRDAATFSLKKTTDFNTWQTDGLPISTQSIQGDVCYVYAMNTHHLVVGRQDEIRVYSKSGENWISNAMSRPGSHRVKYCSGHDNEIAFLSETDGSGFSLIQFRNDRFTDFESVKTSLDDVSSFSNLVLVRKNNGFVVQTGARLVDYKVGSAPTSRALLVSNKFVTGFYQNDTIVFLAPTFFPGFYNQFQFPLK